MAIKTKFSFLVQDVLRRTFSGERTFSNSIFVREKIFCERFFCSLDRNCSLMLSIASDLIRTSIWFIDYDSLIMSHRLLFYCAIPKNWSFNLLWLRNVANRKPEIKTGSKTGNESVTYQSLIRCPFSSHLYLFVWLQKEISQKK